MHISLSRGAVAVGFVQREDLSALAAAIRISENAGCVGTVSIAGPTIRLTPDIQEHLAPSVIEAASSLSSLWPARMLQPEIRRQTRDLVARAGS